MNTTQTASQKLAALIAGQSTARLVESFALTDALDLAGVDPIEAAAVYTTRGVIMDELERRHEDAFNAWIESDTDIGEAFAGC